MFCSSSKSLEKGAVVVNDAMRLCAELVMFLKSIFRVVSYVVSYCVGVNREKCSSHVSIAAKSTEDMKEKVKKINNCRSISIRHMCVHATLSLPLNGKLS